jgi:hypothetical protein
MANTILTPTAVTREALRILHQKLNFVGSIDRQYDASFARDGAKQGESLKIRLPNQYTVTDGATLGTQDTSEISTTLQVSTQKHVGMTFSTAELTLSLDDFSQRIIDPAMSALAANVEADAMKMYQQVWNTVPNVGAAATYDMVLDGRVKLQNALTPSGNRTANLNPLDMADIVKDTKGLFNDQGQLGKQYREGYLGRAAGLDFVENTLWPAHSAGSANTITCNTSTGITSGSGTITVAVTGSFNTGDVITIAGVFEVHPESKESTGRLQQFVVQSANGATTSIDVLPVPVTSDSRQNVEIVSPGAGKAVTMVLTSAAPGTSLLYSKEAFAFATADLTMPRGVDWSAREVLDGLSLRIVRQYDISEDMLPCRVDILYGFKAVRPEFACRLHSN